MNKSKANDLEHDPVGGLLFRLAVPAICAQIVNMLYNIVDRIFIGHIPGIGAAALTGVGVTFPVILLIAAFAALIGMGGAPRASICMGAGRDQDAEHILGNCFGALLIIAAVLTVVFYAVKDPLLVLFGASPDTLPYASSYLGIYVWGTVFVQIALGMNSFLTAQGRALVGMLTVVLGAVMNLTLDPILIFGLGMGVRGAALATVISQAASALWVVYVLRQKRNRLRLRGRYLRPRAAILLPVLALGASPFVMQSTESLLSITFNISLQQYGGDLAVGAMTVLTSLMQMLNMPLFGLTAGAQPIISYSLGARLPGRVKHAVKLLTISALCYTTLFWLVVQLMPGVLAGFFTDDPELIGFSAWAMHIYFATAFVLALQNALQQSFIALGEAKISLFLALLRKVILLIPLILLLPYLFADQVFAVFLAEPVSDFISVCVVIFLFRRRFSKIIRGITPGNPQAN